MNQYELQVTYKRLVHQKYEAISYTSDITGYGFIT